MKAVCLVGVLNKEGSTNISQAKSFIKNGFDVIPINYRTIIQNYGMVAFEDMLLTVMKTYRPYLTLFSKCNGINPKLVKECGKYSYTWLWNMDPIQTIEKVPEVIEHAKNANFSSCTGLGVAKWFESQGVTNCYHIFDGLDEEIFKPVPPVDRIKADISFIGSRTPERDRYKKVLEDIGLNVKFYGPGYNQEVVNEAFSQVCSSSKFMLSLNVFNNIEGYFSNRLLRYMGCGACVFHLDKTNTLKNYFNDGEHLILFEDEVDLANKVKKISESEAKEIAKRGREFVLKNYRWDNTIQNILNIVSEAPRKKLLINYHHGLGDIIALTPQLRYFYENGYLVDLMARPETKTTHMLDKCPYVDKIIEIENPWRGEDGLRSKNEFDRVLNSNIKKMKSMEGYDLKLNVDHTNIKQDIPKVLYNTYQCGILGPMSFDKEVFIPKKVENRVKKEIKKRFPNGYAFVHLDVPNHQEHSMELTDDFKKDLGMPIFDTSKEKLDNDINYTFAYLKYAKVVILSSSVMAQAAEALGKKINILNFGRIDLKVLPPHYMVDNILFKGEPVSKEEIYSKLKMGIDDRKVLISGAGRSGTNWLTEIVRASDEFKFTEAVEDRNLFNYESLPGQYGTKLATENKGFNWKNMDKMMDKNKTLKVLFSVRHPVDLCMAKIKRGQPSSQGGDGSNKLAPDATVNGSIKAAKKMYKLSKKLKEKYPDRVMFVKLEDLIENTENEVKKIARFLGTGINDKMLNAQAFNRNTHHQKRYGGEIDKSQRNLFKRWNSVYNEFFKDKKDDLTKICNETKHIVEWMNYEEINI